MFKLNMNRKLINMSNLEKREINMDNWEIVSTKQMSKAKKRMFKRNVNIVRDYLYTSDTVLFIAEKYKVNIKEVRRYVKRALLLDKNGKIFGYQALIPGKHLEGYSTINEKVKRKIPTKFEEVIKKTPNSEVFFDREIKKYIAGKSRSIKAIHQIFLHNIVKNGHPTYEYPFTIQDKGYRGFLDYFKSRKEEVIKHRVENTTPFSLENLRKPVLRPFEQVEIDGHRIDAYFITEIETPTGTKTKAVIERPWLLTVIDRSTRCILGYHLALKTEYNSEDVLQCITNSLIPQKTYKMKNELLTLNPTGGLPNQHLKKAPYAVYSELYLDNALSHLSKITLAKTVDLLGINVVFGKVAEPTRRPIVERFFKTLESNGFHNLKSTTGSNPDDPIRVNPERKALKYEIDIDDLRDITYSVIYNYNGQNHESLYGNSPLEDMRQKLEKYPVNYLPIELQNGSEFFTYEYTRVVRSNGTINLINYEGAKYFSSKLNIDSTMLGQEITIRTDIRDLRKLKSFRKDGSFYDELYVETKWRNKPHSLKERKAINKLIRLKAFDNIPNENYLDAYEYYLMNQRNKNNKSINKNAATKLAHRKDKFKTNKTKNDLIKPKKKLKGKHESITNEDLFNTLKEYDLKSQN